MAKYMAMAGKISPKKKNEPKPKRGRPSTGLEMPVQVNFTPEQKRLLEEKSHEAGLALATFIRMKALEGLK